MIPRALFLPVWLIMIGFAVSVSHGHEVDQYSLPAGDSLLDMQGYWNNLLYGAVTRAIDNANGDIAAEKKSWVPDVGGLRLARRQSPETLTKYVRAEFPSALSLIESIEANLEATNFRDLRSGRRLAYRADAESSAYRNGPALPDMRHWNKLLFMRCSTIKVHGHYLGTDKLGHFAAMGYHYYTAYRAARLVGQSHESALRSACSVCGSVSENSFLGTFSTGIYSNADMAANYMGLRFYLNVTRPVTLRGRQVPPIAKREGDYWKLNNDVSRNCPLWAMYISVHWDEVLNPCHFSGTVHSQVEEEIAQRSGALLDWYAGNDPQRRNPEYFNGILQHCVDYYGEDYGHSGKTEQLLGLGNVCFRGTTAQAETTILLANRSPSVWSKVGKRNAGAWWNGSRTSSYPFSVWRVKPPTR